VPVVVSDTSPVVALANLGLLHLLEKLFAQVLVPPAVAVELQRPRQQAAPIPLEAVPFLRIQRPQDDGLVQRLQMRLDPGESEAIALALEVRAEYLLVDEFRGRWEATRLGLRTTGVLGVLLMGKAAGLIPQISPLVDRLRQQFRFFISDEIASEVRRAAGE
jgi:hypothetical protein